MNNASTTNRILRSFCDMLPRTRALSRNVEAVCDIVKDRCERIQDIDFEAIPQNECCAYTQVYSLS